MLTKKHCLGALAASLAVGAVEASAQTVEDNWFASRVREIAPSARPDFKPDQAGYVRLTIEVRNAQNAALCPQSGAELSRLRRASSGLFKDFLGVRGAWGVAGQIWYTPTGAEAAPMGGAPTLEHNVVSVEKTGGAKSCQPLSDNTDLATPLLRADMGMAPIRVGVASWLVEEADPARLERVRGFTALAAGLAGAPATLLAPMLNGAQTTFTQRINANTRMGHRDTFDLGSPDAGKILRVHFGRTPPADIATWTPGADDPYAEIKLVTVGSAFDRLSTSYPDLSNRTSGDILDRTQLANRSVREHLRGDEYDKLQRATSVDALDAACVDLRRTIGGKTGLSPADEALAIYHLAMEHETLGGRNLTGAELASAPFLQATCIRNLAPSLKQLGVQIPERPKPEPIAPNSLQMRNALNGFVAVLGADDSEAAGSVAQLAFSDKLTIQDSEGVLGGGEIIELSTVEAIGRQVMGSFGRAGCWLPYPEQTGAPWPVGFAREKTWVRMAAALATTDDGATPLLVRFEFDADAAGAVGKITRIDVRTRFGQTTEAFRATYPSGCAGGALRPDAVFAVASAQ